MSEASPFPLPQFFHTFHPPHPAPLPQGERGFPDGNYLFPVKKAPFSKEGDKEITDILDDRMFLRYKYK